MMQNRIELFRAGFRKRGWAFRFRAGNGEIVAQSEVYRDKLQAKSTAAAVANGFVATPIEEVER